MLTTIAPKAATGMLTGSQESQASILHTAVRERRGQNEYVENSEPVWRQNRLSSNQESSTSSSEASRQKMGRHTNFVMSSLNSQYAASIVSGSAQTPLVQVLPSTLGRPRYRKFPTAMATRYGGMGMGYSEVHQGLRFKLGDNEYRPACTRR